MGKKIYICADFSHNTQNYDFEVHGERYKIKEIYSSPQEADQAFEKGKCDMTNSLAYLKTVSNDIQNAVRRYQRNEKYSY